MTTIEYLCGYIPLLLAILAWAGFWYGTETAWKRNNKYEHRKN